MAELDIDTKIETKTPGASPTYAPTDAANRSPASGARWTFFTNHAHVLILLYKDPELLLREVAAQVGITERAVQRIVQELEEGGFLKRERTGRRNHYKVLADKPLRHAIESHCQVQDVLRLVAGIDPPDKQPSD